MKTYLLVGILSGIISSTLMIGCSSSTSSAAKTSAAKNLGASFVSKLAPGSASRLAIRFALSDSIAEYNVQALADAAVADVLDSTDGFTRTRNLGTDKVADNSGLGAAGPEFVIAVLDRLDDQTFHVDAASPPTTLDKVLIASKVLEVVTEAIATSDGSGMSAAEKESLLGDMSESIVDGLDQAGLTDAELVEWSDDVNRVIIENLDEIGFDNATIISVVSEMSEGASAGFVAAEISASLADDYMNNMAAGFASEFVEIGFTVAELTSGVGEFVQGAAEGSEYLGLNDSVAEANAYMQGLLERVHTVVDIDEAAIADDIEAGYLASGMSPADSASVEDTMDSYNPVTMAPDQGAISADPHNP